MTCKEFISNIDNVNKKLSEVLEEQIAALKNSKNQFKSILLKKEETDIKEITVLESALQKENEQFLKSFEEINKNKKDLNEELVSAVLNYKKMHKAEVEAKRLKDLKPKHLADFTASYKKKRTELNQKLSNLEKECTLKMIEFENKKALEDKAVKNKNSELVRRLNNDLEKAAALAEESCKDLEITILEENDDKVIKEKKGEQRKLRISGLENQFILKSKYYEEIKNNDLNFLSIEEKINMDMEITKKEYELKISNLQYELKKLDNEEKYRDDIYEYESEMKLYEYEKNNQVAITNIEDDFNSKRYNLEKEHLAIDLQYNNKVKEAVFRLYQEYFAKDAEKLKLYSERYLNDESSIQKIIDGSLESLLSIIERMYSYLIEKIEEVVKDRHDANVQIFNALLIAKYQRIAATGFDYKKFAGEAEELVESHYTQEVENLVGIKNNIRLEVETIKEQIEKFFVNLKHFQAEISLRQKSLQQSLQLIIKRAYEKSTKDNDAKNEAFTVSLNTKHLEIDNAFKEHKLNITNIVSESFSECESILKQKNQNIKLFSKSIASRAKIEESNYKDEIKGLMNEINNYGKNHRRNLRQRQIEMLKKYKQEIVTAKEEMQKGIDLL